MNPHCSVHWGGQGAEAGRDNRHASTYLLPGKKKCEQKSGSLQNRWLNYSCHLPGHYLSSICVRVFFISPAMRQTLPMFFLSLCWYKSALAHTKNLPQRLKCLSFVAAAALPICMRLTSLLQYSDYFHKLQSVFIVAIVCLQWIWQTMLKDTEEICHTEKPLKTGKDYRLEEVYTII